MSFSSQDNLKDMEHPIFQFNLLKILLQLATPRILLALLFHWLKANLLSLKSATGSAYPNPVIGMDYPILFSQVRRLSNG